MHNEGRVFFSRVISEEGALSVFMDQSQEWFCLCPRQHSRGRCRPFAEAQQFPEGPGPGKSGRLATILSCCLLKYYNFYHVFQNIFQGGWFHLKIIFFVFVLSSITEFLEIAEIELEDPCALTSHSSHLYSAKGTVRYKSRTVRVILLYACSHRYYDILQG